MTSFKRSLAAFSAMAMVISSSAVSAQSVRPSESTVSAAKAVSTGVTRAGVTTQDASAFRGRGGFIIPLAAILAIIAGLLVITDGDDDATSP